MRSALKRTSSEGFLSLIPAAEPATPDRMLEAIDTLARMARIEACDSRSLALNAVYLEEEKMPGLAQAKRAQSNIAHRRAADKLHKLALACRELVEWASLDWLPTSDVVGSGLTELELVQLCSVMGMPIDRLREAHDDAKA